MKIMTLFKKVYFSRLFFCRSSETNFASVSIALDRLYYSFSHSTDKGKYRLPADDNIESGINHINFVSLKKSISVARCE
jgi:hypothetical protein